MQAPIQVSFRHMERSEAIEAIVREKATVLDNFASDITSCKVVVEPIGKHHRVGNLYDVRIDLITPGAEIVVNRESSQQSDYKNIHVAIRDAFESAKRQLEDWILQRRRNVKTHTSPLHGKVAKVFPAEGYGFIESSDGREIYFHKNSVLRQSFDRLEVGTEVAFVEEEGEKGPQASTVKVVGKHHHL